jgi:CheY-like chemotaxis protein
VKKHILLVDDEPNIRVVLSAVLQQAGYEVDVAEDGFAALHHIQKSLPDLVITDLRMPNMNGFELLSVIRTRFPQVPTIAISGEFFALEVQQGLLADAFFQKGSYSLPDFLSKISALLVQPATTREIPHHAPVWAPTAGDAPLMLTCTGCLRSFPIDTYDGSLPPRKAACIFCGQELHVQLIAIGVAATHDD